MTARKYSKAVIKVNTVLSFAWDVLSFSMRFGFWVNKIMSALFGRADFGGS